MYNLLYLSKDYVPLKKKENTEIPSKQEIRNALEILGRYVECRGDQQDVEYHRNYELFLNKLLSRNKQKKITDYFKVVKYVSIS